MNPSYQITTLDEIAKAILHRPAENAVIAIIIIILIIGYDIFYRPIDKNDTVICKFVKTFLTAAAFVVMLHLLTPAIAIADTGLNINCKALDILDETEDNQIIISTFINNYSEKNGPVLITYPEDECSELKKGMSWTYHIDISLSNLIKTYFQTHPQTDQTNFK